MFSGYKLTIQKSLGKILSINPFIKLQNSSFYIKNGRKQWLKVAEPLNTYNHVLLKWGDKKKRINNRNVNISRQTMCNISMFVCLLVF